MTASKGAPRPGGRAARVQAAVHGAVRVLLAEVGRPELTVPMVAARAGVTPSTIYRRWGDIQELLADVAVERLRPDGVPRDTGSAKADLLAWLEQYADEMSSEVGRTMLRDVLASTAEPGRSAQCCGFTLQQIEIIAERASARGENFPDPRAVIDHAVAPVIYRTLFDEGDPTPDYCRALVDRLIPAD